MTEIKERKTEMSTVEFVQNALREHVAPPSVGSVKARIFYASRKLRWGYSRTKDCWYAAPTVSIRGDELSKIEETTGLRYGRQEVREIGELIHRADALLDGPEADFYRPFVAAFKSFVGTLNRTGTEGD